MWGDMRITGKKLEQVVYGYWARRFGINYDDINRLGTSIIEEEDLINTGKVIIYTIDKRVVVRIDPSLVKELSISEKHYKNSLLDTAELSNLLNKNGYKVKEKSTLLDCYLDPKDFVEFKPEDKFIARELNIDDDKAYMDSFFGVCSEEDLDKADIFLDNLDPVNFGIFHESQLVAYASSRYWENTIADIGVLIHPKYRGKGLGKAVVSKLCNWCIENQVVPMYRVFDYHIYSLRIPQSLGFEELVIIESIKVEKC